MEYLEGDRIMKIMVRKDEVNGWRKKDEGEDNIGKC